MEAIIFALISFIGWRIGSASATIVGIITTLIGIVLLSIFSV